MPRFLMQVIPGHRRNLLGRGCPPSPAGCPLAPEVYELMRDVVLFHPCRDLGIQLCTRFPLLCRSSSTHHRGQLFMGPSEPYSVTDRAGAACASRQAVVYVSIFGAHVPTFVTLPEETEGPCHSTAAAAQSHCYALSETTRSGTCCGYNWR